MKYWIQTGLLLLAVALLAVLVYELSEVNTNLDGVQRDIEGLVR